MNEKGSHTINLKIKRSSDELDITKEKINNFLKLNNINEEILSRIELSIYEVLINIVEHTPAKYKDKDISIECSIIDKNIKAVISNEGESFDLTKVKLPDIVAHYKEGKKRGLGIYFIRTLMDKVVYSYKDNINILTLFKDI